MKVKFKAIPRREQPGVVDSGYKYYATIVRRDRLEFRDFIKEIARLSTVNTPDVMAMMESLVQLLPIHLSAGRTVRFGDLGDFYLSLSSNGEDTPQEVDQRSIRSAKIVFRPGLEMKEFINNLKFDKVGNPILGDTPEDDDQELDNAA